MPPITNDPELTQINFGAPRNSMPGPAVTQIRPTLAPSVYGNVPMEEPPAPLDSHVAAQWAAEALRDGRIELGYHLADLARRCRQFERAQAERDKERRLAAAAAPAPDIFKQTIDDARAQRTETAPCDACTAVAYYQDSADGGFWFHALDELDQIGEPHHKPVVLVQLDPPR